MTISTEQFLAINVGAAANDGTGDTLRNAFIKVNDNFANITTIGFNAGNINVQGGMTVAGNVTVANVYVPTLANSVGTTGQVTWDNDYVYVCIATDTWKRANLTAW